MEAGIVDRCPVGIVEAAEPGHAPRWAYRRITTSVKVEMCGCPVESVLGAVRVQGMRVEKRRFRLDGRRTVIQRCSWHR